MISNHLSLVEALRPKSMELAGQVEQYLAAGGEIHFGPNFGHKQPEISLHYPPDFQCATVKEESNELVDRLRKLAEMMAIDEVMAETGLTRGTLRGLSKKHRIKFQHAVGRWEAPNKVNPEAEAKLVEQIYECMNQKMTQNKARQHIGISYKLIQRLIRDYKIPYPVVTHSCAA